MLSEERKSEIRKEARAILDKFGVMLENVDINVTHGRAESVFREEGDGYSEEGFRDRMFANAPNVKGECIVAEKAQW